MSILASKPKFTSWVGDFGRGGWEIQNKVTKLFVNILKIWCDMSMFQVLASTLSPWLKNFSLSATDSIPTTIPVTKITFLYVGKVLKDV